MRRAALLYSSVFVMHVGFAAGYTGVPLLAKRAFGATVWELALLGLAWAGSYTFLCLGTALVAGRARPGVFALAGSVAYAAAYGSAALTSNLWHLAGVQLLAALAGALYWPMIEAAIARGAGGHRLRRRMGLFNISWSAGDALGAAAGGLLFDVWERLPFLSLPLISGLAAAFIVAALRRPEDELDASPRSRGEAASPARHRGHLGDEEKRPGAEARGGPGRRADQTGREEEEPEPPPAGRHERGGPGRRADQTGREEDRPGRDLPGGSSSPEDGDVRVREFSSGGSHPAGSALSAREGEAPAGVRCRFRRAAWLANFIAYGVVGVLRSIFAAPAADVFGMAPTAYGLVIGTFNGLRTVTFAVLRRWRSWHYRPRLLLLSIGLIGLSMAAVVAAAFLPSAAAVGVVFTAFAAAGVGCGGVYYSSIYYSVAGEALAEAKTRLHEAAIGAGTAASVVAAAGFKTLSAGALGAGPAVELAPFALCALAAGAGVAATARILGARAGGGERT